MTFKNILALLLITFSLTVSAAHRSSAVEAKAMFDKAVAAYQADSKTALADFNNTKGTFTKRDLYVFVIDGKGNYLASGANPSLVGQPFRGAVDAAGTSLYDKIKVALATKQKPATVDYVWLNRQTNQVESKTSFVTQSGDAIIGVGYYY